MTDEATDLRAAPRQSPKLAMKLEVAVFARRIFQSFTSQSCLFQSRAILAAQTPNVLSIKRKRVIVWGVVVDSKQNARPMLSRVENGCKLPGGGSKK